MWESGPQKALDMAKAFRFGKMVLGMMATGKMTWLTEKEDSFILMEMLMKVIGTMIRPMDEVLISIWMVQYTLEIGKKTNNMGMELRHGLMVQSMKEIMNMVKNMELAPSNMRMDHCTLVNSITIKFMARESTHGSMVADMRVNGELTKCTGKVPLPWLMVVNTLVNTLKTRDKVTENTYGSMARITKEIGLMANNMERAYILIMRD